MNTTLSLISMIVVVGILIFFMLRGYRFELFAIILSSVMLVISGQGFIVGLKDVFMPAAADYFMRYLLLIFTSTIFANVMRDTGAALGIASGCIKLVDNFKSNKRFVAVYLAMLCTAILSIGGVNFYVVMFISVPIVRDLFHKLDIPWHLAGCMVLGMSSFSLGGLPGMTSQNNIMASEILGTSPAAGPVLGFIGSGIMLVFGTAYIWYAVSKSEKKEEKFFPTGKKIMESDVGNTGEKKNLNFIHGIIPPALVLILLNGVGLSAELSMVIGAVFCAVIYNKNIRGKDMLERLVGTALTSSIATVCAVSCIAAFGTILVNADGFSFMVDTLTESGISILWLVFLITNVCSFFSGNGSVAITVALPKIMGPILASGENLEVIHRIATISSNGLDAVPHSGAVAIVTKTLGLTMKECYPHWFWNCVVGPTIAAIICIFFANMGIV